MLAGHKESKSLSLLTISTYLPSLQPSPLTSSGVLILLSLCTPVSVSGDECLLSRTLSGFGHSKITPSCGEERIEELKNSFWTGLFLG